jgi:hypothetical protein
LIIEKATDTNGQKSGGALPFIALSTAALAALIAGLFALDRSVANSESAQAGTPSPPQLATPEAHYASVTPTTSGPARAIFAEEIPGFVLALDSYQRGGVDSETKLEAAQKQVLASARKANLDESVVGALDELMQSAVKAADAESREELKAASDDLLDKTIGVNESLANFNLGFCIDRDLLVYDGDRKIILLFTFTVERVALYRGEGRDFRALQLRRLDQLNYTYNLLGFTEAKRHDALILANQVEGRLIELLPALGNLEIDLFHFDKKDRHTSWQVDFRKRANQMIREELIRAGDRVLTEKLGQLLARRVEIFEHWDELLGRDIQLSAPDTLDLDWDYQRRMDGKATKAEMGALADLQQELTSPAMLANFARVYDHYARSVERHEVQHRLDLSGEYILKMPEALSKYVGELPNGYRGEGDMASSALAEMSAYLSELARDPLTVRLNLAMVAGFALNRNHWGGPECYAGLVILEQLAIETGIETRPLVLGRHIQQDAVAETYQKLSELDESTLRSAAGSLWAFLFEHPLPQLEIVSR